MTWNVTGQVVRTGGGIAVRFTNGVGEPPEEGNRVLEAITEAIEDRRALLVGADLDRLALHAAPVRQRAALR